MLTSLSVLLAFHWQYYGTRRLHHLVAPVNHTYQCNNNNHVSDQEVISRTRLSSVGDIISRRHLGLFGHVTQLDSGVPARDVLVCAYAHCTQVSKWFIYSTKVSEENHDSNHNSVPRYALLRAGEDHPGVQGRLGCTRLVMAPQPSSAKNRTLQLDMEILRKRDWHYGPLPLQHSDDNGESNNNIWTL